MHTHLHKKLPSENSVSRTQGGTFWLVLTHNFFSTPLSGLRVPPYHSFPLPAFIPFLPHCSPSPSLPPYHFRPPSLPSPHSYPHSLYTWGSCSFIANWTFHSERNNYSLERKGTAVECWYDTQCHLATQELTAHPAQREGWGCVDGREGQSGSGNGKGEKGYEIKVTQK